MRKELAAEAVSVGAVVNVREGTFLSHQWTEDGRTVLFDLRADVLHGEGSLCPARYAMPLGRIHSTSRKGIGGSAVENAGAVVMEWTECKACKHQLCNPEIRPCRRLRAEAEARLKEQAEGFDGFIHANEKMLRAEIYGLRVLLKDAEARLQLANANWAKCLDKIRDLEAQLAACQTPGASGVSAPGGSPTAEPCPRCIKERAHGPMGINYRCESCRIASLEAENARLKALNDELLSYKTDAQEARKP
jgi:hypothetical protein